MPKLFECPCGTCGEPVTIDGDQILEGSTWTAMCENCEARLKVAEQAAGEGRKQGKLILYRNGFPVVLPGVQEMHAEGEPQPDGGRLFVPKGVIDLAGG